MPRLTARRRGFRGCRSQDGGAPEELGGSSPERGGNKAGNQSPPGRCVIRETMRPRLLSPAKALLVIARPKSLRLTASGKEAFRDRNRKIGANTRRAVCVMLLPSLQS